MPSKTTTQRKVRKNIKPVIAKTVSSTWKSSEVGQLMTNRAATTLAQTLPSPTAVRKGTRYVMYVQSDATGLTTFAFSGVVFNSAAATAIVTGTSSAIGLRAEFVSDGTGWLFIPHQWWNAGVGTTTQITVG